MNIFSTVIGNTNYTRSSAVSAIAAVPPASPTKASAKTQAQQAQLQSLKQTDQHVRQHEAAHVAAAAGLQVSSPSYTYKIGPDGKSYAVGGDVSINTSTVPNDPAATLRKAEAISRAALAPADPSAQDYSVASQANQMAAQARLQLDRMQFTASAPGALLDVQA